MKNRNVLTIVFLLLGLGVFFQNCSKVQFGTGQLATNAADDEIDGFDFDDDSEGRDNGRDEGDGTDNGGDTNELCSSCAVEVPANGILDVRVGANPVQSKVDILFVVDESNSMRTVIDNMLLGLSSLQTFQFPKNTRIASTNMHPAFVTAGGNIDFGRAYYRSNRNRAEIINAPGFIKLVDEQGISHYNRMFPANRNFAKNGCSAWFEPDQKNRQGESCLSAHLQTIFFGVGQEAGIVTVQQLLKRYQMSNEPLFRAGSVANIIFLSDTHDSGASYYGQSGAYAKGFSVKQIEDLAKANSPETIDFKFHAIAPLPATNGPNTGEYTGLNVIGKKPRNASEEDVGENMHNGKSTYKNGYSYLEFVRKSGGVAMHPRATDWKPLMSELIANTQTTNNPLITLASSINAIASISYNGQEIDASLFRLANNGRAIILHESLSYLIGKEISIKFR